MSVERGGRQILLHGLVLVFVGLLWGLAVPQTPYPRLALTAHIQFLTNGLLLVALALVLVSRQARVGAGSVLVMVLAAWAIWPMVLSEVANAWWGAARMLPIAAKEAGVAGGEPWQELVVEITHVAAALALIAAWGLLLLGVARRFGAQADS
jgi:hypothetical protein